MERLPWFDRKFVFGMPAGMVPYYIERLDGTLFRLRQKVKNVSEERLSLRTNLKWSVKQNIGHLAEVDEIACKRIAEMIAGKEIMSPAVFEPKMDYNSMPIEKVLDNFQREREKNLKLYGNLNDDDLSRSSVHPRLKVVMTPVDLAYFDAEHDDHHLVTINELLK